MADIHEQIVDALGRLGGGRSGFRAVHAKGTLCAGTFTATPGATALTSAPHMAGAPVRVTTRFSNGSGDPEAADPERLDGRGMATKFYLPDGGTTDIVAISIPVFFVRTAQDFLDFALARVPDPETGQPDAEKVGAFLAGHPETQAALGAVIPTLVPPRSYAQVAYNALHAFRLVAADGARTLVRYRWEPEAGESMLDDDEVGSAAPEYLQDEIRERLDREPVRFDLIAIVGEDGDPDDDPTAAWPAERRRVSLGKLELTGLDTSRETGDDVLVFDPTRVVEGIELTEDEILHTRSRAYSVSVERRTGVPRPTALA